jgi:hypothetical protein
VIHLALPALLGLMLVQQPAGPVIQAVRIDGASVYTSDEIASRYQLAAGTRLTRTPDELAAAIADRYHDEGYTLATVTATLDEAGTLAIRIDEGRFDSIDVDGVPAEARTRLLDSFALQPGEVFNASQANRALDEALAFAQGAIERARPTFTIVPEAGMRVLRVALRSRSSQTGAFAGTLGREDWYSPVDALNFGVGFHSTLFNRRTFNHAYWAGYVTYKFGPERVGYSLGFERPFFADGILQAGASIEDLTASDDMWRLDGFEQSLVALGFRNTFRDYYRRKGFQLHAAVRPLEQHELLFAWRGEEHLNLVNETNYGLFRDDEVFRANAPARPGDLRALVIGYTFDSRGLTRQRAPERYRHHLLDSLFGEGQEQDRGARLEWRSEIAPTSFDHDFDFNRHIVNARGWWEVAPRRTLSGRVIAGAARGDVPEQRLLALGGIGSVRGYRFKEAVGEGMLLLNGELRHRFGRSGVSGLAMIDAGRVYRPRPGSSDAWMRGVGVGLGFGSESRLEFGWRLDDIPSSLQILFRLQPTF